MMSETAACAAVRAAAAEIALGVLVGTERATALAHLDDCASCRAEVESFAAATDGLFQLVPHADPPAGFEDRLLARRALQEGRSRQTRSRFRVMVAAAAVIVLLGVGTGVGLGIGSLTTGGGSNEQAAVRTAELTSDGVDRGQVAVAAGRTTMLFMTVRYPGWSGEVDCVVTERGGKQLVVGRYSMSSGYGAWMARLSVPESSIKSARIVGDGSTLASGTFRS